MFHSVYPFTCQWTRVASPFSYCESCYCVLPLFFEKYSCFIFEAETRSVALSDFEFAVWIRVASNW